MVETKKKKSGKKIALDIASWTGVALCVVIIAFIIIFATKNPSSNSSASIFGYETRLVVSGSMDQQDESYYADKNWEIKRIKTGSLVFIKSADKVDGYNVGDVVTFFDPKGGPTTSVTHRIIKIEPNASNPDLTKFITHGDNNNEGVNEIIGYGNIIGKVVGTSYFLGLMYTNVFSNKAIVAVIILVPCACIIAFESFKIVKIVKKDKEERLASDNLSPEEKEIYELEKKLSELKKQKKKSKSEGEK